jgi:phenylpyruvate tautomerase PptA (4-oxalocrotonate tautomerase family)
MPVVHVQAIEGRAPDEIDRALVGIAEEVAAAASCPVQTVWCTFDPLPAVAIGTHKARPGHEVVFVNIEMRSRGAEVAAEVLRRTAAGTAAGFGVDVEDVWVRLSEVTPGSVITGGEIV